MRRAKFEINDWVEKLSPAEEGRIFWVRQVVKTDYGWDYLLFPHHWFPENSLRSAEPKCRIDDYILRKGSNQSWRVHDHDQGFWVIQNSVTGIYDVIKNSEVLEVYKEIK